jgi:protein SHQ1
MITPQFSLDQTDSDLIIIVQVPHIRVSVQSVEVVITDGSVVHFCSPPYLLVLNFADALSSSCESEDGGCAPVFDEEAEEDCAQYDPSQHGTLVLRLRKRVPAFWDGLHLLGRFVVSRRPTTASVAYSSTSRWLQELMPNETDGSDIPDVEKHARDEVDAASQISTESNLELLQLSPQRVSGGPGGGGGYGFAHMFRDVLHQDWSKDGMAKEMLEGWSQFWCDWPTKCDESDLNVRRRLRTKRMQAEDDAFSSDRYLQDTDVEDDYIYQCSMSFDPHWRTPFVEFTEGERHHLASIPYPLLPSVVVTGNDRRTITSLLLGAADILFAYVYDHLTTCGEPTVESAWTISILSPSLSWLDDCWQPDVGDVGRMEDGDETTIMHVIRSSLRRSLVYPYLRNLDLALCCARHVAAILSGGPELMIRCLLQARAILNRSDLFYLSNTLYLDPYLAWLQSVDANRQISSFSDRLSEQIESCLLSHDWPAEINLPLIHLEERTAQSGARDSGGMEDVSTGTVETGDSAPILARTLQKPTLTRTKTILTNRLVSQGKR